MNGKCVIWNNDCEKYDRSPTTISVASISEESQNGISKPEIRVTETMSFSMNFNGKLRCWLLTPTSIL